MSFYENHIAGLGAVSSSSVSVVCHYVTVLFAGKLFALFLLEETQALVQTLLTAHPVYLGTNRQEHETS